MIKLEYGLFSIPILIAWSYVIHPGSAALLHNSRNMAISNDVGGVNHILSTRLRALREERHFALVVGFALSNRARFESFGSSVRPSHLRSPTAIMITLFELPTEGSGMPNHYIGALLHRS